jgi:hypothetical protein
MAKQGFKILDSDMHIMEPPDLWERYIESKYKSQAPRGITSDNVRDLRMSIPTAENGRARRSGKTGQSRVTILNAIKSSTEVTRSGDGRRKSSSKPWISRGSTSPCSIPLEA